MEWQPATVEAVKTIIERDLNACDSKLRIPVDVGR